jgi:hypothetical protein
MAKKTHEVEVMNSTARALELGKVKRSKQYATTAPERLDELECDPIALMASIAQGKELTVDHPFLRYLKEFRLSCLLTIQEGGMVSEQDIDDLCDKGEVYLSDSWVSHDLRSKSIAHLVDLTHAKKKDSDAAGEGSGSHDIQPLTPGEADRFLSVFDDRY